MMRAIECLVCFALGGLVASVCVISKLRPVDADSLPWRVLKRNMRFFGMRSALEKARDLECTLRKMYGACLASVIIEDVRSSQMGIGEVIPGVRGVESERSDLLDKAECLYQTRIKAMFGNKFE